MKSTILVLTGLTLGVALANAAGPHGRCAQGSPESGSCRAGDCVLGSAAATPLTLTPAASEALLFQIEEERMAGELYAAFEARWGLRPFTNIQRSEARHKAALAALATRASLALPATTAGTFTSVEVQRRYEQILALGLGSAEAALQAGALVEETDIADLRDLARTTDDPAVLATIAALERASENHLRAFVRNLEARGLSYSPVVLAAADFQAIIAAGGRGRGRGR